MTESQETGFTNNQSSLTIKNPLNDSLFKNKEPNNKTTVINSTALKKSDWIFDSYDDIPIPEESSDEQPSPSQKLTPTTCESKSQQVFNWNRVTEVGGRDKKLERSVTSSTLSQYSSPIAQAQPTQYSLGLFSDVDKDFNFYRYIHQRMYQTDQDWHTRDKYFHEMLRSLGFAKIAQSGSPTNQPSCFSLSPVRNKERSLKKHSKIIMLDLDETLVRAEPYNYDKGYSGVINVKVAPERFQNFGVFVRPFTKEFLEVISREHKVVVYTASVQEYAEKIVGLIDPDSQFIDQILSRQHCAFLNGIFIKDLSVAVHSEYQLENIIIVDNYVHSFALHFDHGIPIKPYYGEPGDKELLHLANMLYLSSDYPRLVDFVKEHFDFSSLYSFLENNQTILLTK